MYWWIYDVMEALVDREISVGVAREREGEKRERRKIVNGCV